MSQQERMALWSSTPRHRVYTDEVLPILLGKGDTLDPDEYKRLSGRAMRVATITTSDGFEMAISIPRIASGFQPVYSILGGAVFIVSVRPSGPHAIMGNARLGQLVVNWCEMPPDPHMQGPQTLPTIVPPGPGPTAPEADVTVFPTGPRGTDGEPVAPH
jgi:hypothetical protein